MSNSSRVESRARAGISALLAMGFLIACCLCCKPAWSPDSSKVAFLCSFPRGEEERGYLGVAVYDVATQQTEIVYKGLSPDARIEATDDSRRMTASVESALVPAAFLWRDKDTLLYVLTESGKSEKPEKAQVFRYDCATTTRTKLREVAVAGETSEPPDGSFLLQSACWLWSMDDAGCYRTNLKSGKTKQLENADCVFGAGNNLYAVRELDDESFTFSKVSSLWGLRSIPLFTVKKEGDEELMPVAAVPRDVKRFACLHSSGDSARRVDVLDRKGRVSKQIALPAEFDPSDSALGSQWSHDGKRLWLSNSEEMKIIQVDIDSGTVTPIALQAKPFYLSFSPDGRYLAAAVACGWGKDDNEEAGLFLLDTTSAKHASRLIVPAMAAGSAPNP